MATGFRLLPFSALLLIATSGRAQQIAVSSQTVGLSDNQAQSIQVTTSNVNPVAYTVTGKPFWLNIFTNNGFTTSSASPDTLFFQLGNTNCGTCAATISVAGPANTVNVSVTYSPGSGILSASSTALTFSAVSGQAAGSQAVTLSTSSPGGVTISSITSDSPLWLTAAITAGGSPVTPANPSTLAVTATAASLQNGTYIGHITVTPATGTATVITATFTVGSSSSTITANPSSLSISASTGQAAQQQVTLTTTSATAVPFVITSDAAWLQYGITSGTFSVSSANSSVLSILGNAASLSNGTYTGHITITPQVSGGTSTVVTVAFIVGGNPGQGTITTNPASLSFSANAGGTALQQNLTLSTSSTSAVNFTAAADQSWISVAVVSGCCSVSSSNSAVLTIGASAAGPANGTYTGHIIITPSVGTSTTVLVTVVVSTGGTQATITSSQTSIQFAYPSGTQHTTVKIDTNNPAVTRFNVNIVSQGNWLLFGGVYGSFTQVPFNDYDVSVDPTAASGLAAGTYSGTITLMNPNNSTDTTRINVTLALDGGGSNLTISPPALTFAAYAGGPSQSQSVTVTIPGSGSSIQMQASTSNGPFFTVSSLSTPSCSGAPSNSSPLACSFTGSQTLTITVNPTNLSTLGAYDGVISFASGGASVSLPMTMRLISPVAALTTDQTGLNFTGAVGSTSQTLPIVVTVPAGANVTANISTSSGSFFSVSSMSCSGVPNSNLNCSFTGNQTLYVTVNPAALTIPGPYAGNISLQSGGVSLNIPVTLSLTAGGAFVATPATLMFAAATGQGASPQNVTVSTSSSSPITITGIASDAPTWLSAAVTAGSLTISASSPATLAVYASAINLAVGQYTGHITLTPATGPAIVITVSFSVGTVSTQITATPSSLTFAANAGQVAASQNLVLSTGSATAVNFSITSDATWLQTSPVSGSYRLPRQLRPRSP